MARPIFRCPNCKKFTVTGDAEDRLRLIEEQQKIIQPGEPLICTVCYKEGKEGGKKYVLNEEDGTHAQPYATSPSRVIDVVIINGEPVAKWFTELYTPPPDGRERYQLALPNR